MSHQQIINFCGNKSTNRQSFSNMEPPNFYLDPPPSTTTLSSSSLSLLQQPHEQDLELSRFGGESVLTIKKLTHNASERDRRKRVNSLYASLRSLLPNVDKTRKLSMPSTVAKVVKYIPELQEEVEMLVRKKEELVTIISSNGDSRRGDDVHEKLCRRDDEIPDRTAIRLMEAVSVNSIGDGEIVIQLSATKDKNRNSCSFPLLLTKVSQKLEIDGLGLDLLNASCFETLEKRVFYCLHLKVLQERDYGEIKIEMGMLKEKLLTTLLKTRGRN